MNALNFMIGAALGFYLSITVVCLMLIAGTDRKDEGGDA